MIICKLPENVIRQIAAGEIILRPLSIFKELVENSIDAKADKIKIFVENGGKTRLMIEDNGIGISDLQLAIMPHTTSKFDKDLFNIQYYGFRGEALASIASVSRLQIKSLNQVLDVAFSTNGTIGSIKPRQGTQIFVDNLFYQIPARLKFLRADKTEYNLIKAYLQKMLIMYPNIEFSIQHNESQPQKYHIATYDERMRMLFEDLYLNAISINYTFDKYAITGWLNLQTNTNMLHLFINERPIRDKGIIQCIKNAFLDHMPNRRSFFGVLFLRAPRNEIDVNIHPTKEEVRFLRWLFIETKLTQYFASLISMLVHKKSYLHSIEADMEQTDILDTKLQEDKNSSKILLSNFNNENNIHRAITTVPNAKQSVENIDMQSVSHNKAHVCRVQDLHLEKEEALDITIPKYKLVGQLFHSYIMIEQNEHIIIIDQHAVQERYLYNKLKGATQATKLLQPIQIILTPQQLEFIETNSHKLTECFLEFEIKDQDVFITAVPEYWVEQNITLLVENFLQDITNIENADNINWRTIFGRILADITCKRSLKANHKLNEEEMHSVINNALNQEEVCNHGRRSVVRITKKQLGSWFDR